MFKEFIKRIVASEDGYAAMRDVFYGTKWDDDGNVIEYGIDIAYQHGKISYADHELLLELIGKMKY